MPISLILSFMVMGMMSCGLTSNTSSKSASDTVTFMSSTYSDSISFKGSDKKEYKINATSTFMIPIIANDQNKTKQIQSLFYQIIISDDSCNYNPSEWAKIYTKSALEELGIPGGINTEYISNNECDENEMSAKYSMDTNIKPVFNRNNLLSMEKAEKFNNNKDSDSWVHTYYNFNVTADSILNISDIFNEDKIPELTDLLKKTLMKQVKVSNAEEMISLGYFNLDNLSATNNFYISSQGLTWVFIPYEIACFSIGETRVFLDYSSISTLINKNSIINQFISE